MKKLNFLTLLLAIILCCSLCTTAMAFAEDSDTDVYEPIYAVFNSDSFENYTVAHGDTDKVTTDSIWNNSPLLWVEGTEFETITDGALNGGQSLKWNAVPYQGDTEGWTNTRIGVSASKMKGTEGGYMLKLTFLVKMQGMERLVVKARTVGDGDPVVASMAIDGDYNRITAEQDSGLLQNDKETEISVDQRDGYAQVSFAFRSSATATSYFCFDAKIDTSASTNYVVFDDITVHLEQTPDVTYRPYKAFVNEGFECDNFADTIFSFDAQTNLNSNKNTNLDTEKSTIISDGALFGSKSATFYTSKARSVTTINSKTINLSANYYKLYFLVKYTSVNNVGINVVNADDDTVIYSFNYDVTKGSRVEGASITLFDRYSYTSNTANVYTAYGEFNVENATNVYLQLRFTGSNKNKSTVTFDDVCLLQSYVYDEIATEMPATDSKKVTGNWNAEYEQIGTTLYNTISAYQTEITSGVAILCVGSVCVGGVVSKKKKKYLCIVMSVLMMISILLSAVACSTKNETTIEKGWQVVSPEKISGKLDNPGIGWVVLEEPTYGGHIDIGSSGDLPEASMGSLSTTWAHIETSEDVYDWTMCDQAVDYWTGTGRRVLLRISTDSCVWPYTYNASPSYLFDKYNVGYEMVPYTDSGPVKTARVTNMADPVYQERLGKFLQALCEHYKDNDMVETVEIRGFGMWGEWHHGYGYESTEQRVSVLYDIIDQYVDAFAQTGKSLAVSCSWDPDYISTGAYTAGYTDEEAYQNYVTWSAFDKAWRTDGVGYRRDGAASALRYDYDERLMAEAFRSGKRVPILGEYANNYYTITAAGSQYTLESALDDMLFKIRPNNATILGWVAVEMANIIAAGDTDFIDRGNEMLGYRLSVDEALFPTEVSAGSSFTVRTTWSNSAVGIYPYVSPLRLMLLDESGNVVYTYDDGEFDARTFVLGEINNVYSDITIPSSLQNGTYSLAVAIPFEQHSATEHEYIALAMAGETATNSRIYKLGDIKVKNNVKIGKSGIVKTTWDKIDSLKLDANSTYEITFKYQPHFDANNFYFGTDDCYKFSVKNSQGESNVYRWQDISGEVGQKTITVHTGKGKSTIAIESINFDRIGVDEVWVEKKGGYYTDFTEYDPLDSKTLVMPIAMGLADISDVQMTGDALLLNSRSTNVKHLLAKTDASNVTLQKGVRYTVSFDFRAEQDVGDGGYYFIALGNGNSNATTLDDNFEVIGQWYERADNWDTKKTFSFVCTEDGQSVFFGICMPGAYYIDNLVITATPGSVIEGIDVGFKRNVIPDYSSTIGLNKVETFTKGTFQSCGFNWGQFAWGRMTFDSNEIVGVTEGSSAYMNAEVGTKDRCSLLGRVEIEAYDPVIDNQWFEFARTKLEYYPFEAGKTYTVEFDYKILKKFGSGKIFVFFRDDTLADRFAHVVEIPDGGVAADTDISTGKNVGVDYHFKQTFTMQDYDNYQFMICMNGLWEMAIDNVFIYEGTETPAV